MSLDFMPSWNKQSKNPVMKSQQFFLITILPS